MKHNHIPQRTCKACGKKTYKSKLIRFVFVHDQIVADPEKTRHGRGAYCCDNAQCLGKLQKKKKILSKALRLQI